MLDKTKDEQDDKPSIFPNTLFTAPTHPWQDIPTLRTTVCNWKQQEFKA